MTRETTASNGTPSRTIASQGLHPAPQANLGNECLGQWCESRMLEKQEVEKQQNMWMRF